MIAVLLEDSLAPNWSDIRAEDISPAVEHVLAISEEKISAIEATQELTYDTVLDALVESTEELTRVWGKVGHLNHVCNTPEIREAHNAVRPKVDSFLSSISLREDLWNVVKKYAETDDAKSLTGAQKRHLEEVIKDFVEEGANLDAKSKKELESLNAELSAITQQFADNSMDSRNAWEMIVEDESRLAGIPKNACEAAREDALAKGYGTADQPKWRFTLQYPSYLPLMEYAEDEQLRKQAWEGMNMIAREGEFDNKPLIAKILRLRQRKAELLGYENFADSILNRRMAKNGATALSFTEDLHVRVDRFAKAEMESLQNFKAEQTDSSPGLLEPWDKYYWSEKQRKALYDFDEEELRPYFSVQKVQEGLFDLCERLYGIKIEKAEADTWHKEVEYYKISDADGRLVGTFYSDWFPRDTKRGGAWMGYLSTGKGKDPSVGYICGNMTRPVGDKPALMTHREVETIFHEFGHLLHHMFGEIEVKPLTGVNVAWDFVELPSQIMENWCWERESLNMFAVHYETGESIPDDLFNRLLKTRTFQQGLAFNRQLGLSKLDLELHINHRGNPDQDTDDFLDAVLEPYLAKYATNPLNLSCNFSHLFSCPVGYASAYYSYKWAEVLDADAFTRFKKEGIMSRDVGREFREKILSRGNSRPADELYRDFMGREPNLDALLERAGLVESEAIAN